MKRRFIRIHNDDNLIVALEKLEANEIIQIGEIEFALVDDIKQGHKVAIKYIREGESIIKYGHAIGHATADIKSGSWIHSHNTKTNLSDKTSYNYLPIKFSENKSDSKIPTFLGYKRKNGKVGTRNEIWIINTVGCVNSTAERIAKICSEKFKSENFDGIFSFSHPYGCSQLGDDLENTQKVLSGLIQNPNAGGVLVIGLGCENNQMRSLLNHVVNFNKERIKSFNSQDVADEINE